MREESSQPQSNLRSSHVWLLLNFHHLLQPDTRSRGDVLDA